MSYEPTTWKSGDTVTSAKLNKIEQGIANAGGGGAFVVSADIGTGTLDKTWQEVIDASLTTTVILVIVATENSVVVYNLGQASAGDSYGLTFFNASTQIHASADSADGYPVISQG